MDMRRFVPCLAAAVMFFALSGCAGIQSAGQSQQCDCVNQPKQAESQVQQAEEEQPEQSAEPDPANVRLSAAEDLLAKGDIEGALRENQKALALAGKQPPGDRAIYNMGLIYLHYRNTQKNYEKAAAQFDRLIKEYPDSPLVEEAKTWSGVLQVIEKLKQVDIDIEQKKKDLSR